MADKKPTYINHPLLVKDKIRFRKYQNNIAKVAAKKNTLVVLPTALGKTIIGLLSIVRILYKAPHSKILILAPTRPLVLQHYNTFQDFLIDKVRCCLISSNLGPIKRAYALNENDIFFSTPQIIQNDLKAGLYDLKGFSQIIFDESHKARKRYAYTFVAAKYFEQCTHPLTLGLTASPGKDLFRINDLCRTLKTEEIMFRNDESEDIKEYIYATEEIIRNIEMPDEIFKSQLILDTAIRKIMDYLYERDILPKRKYTSKFQFIQLMQDMKKIDILTDPYLREEDYERYDISPAQLNFPHLLDVFQSSKNGKSPHHQSSNQNQNQNQNYPSAPSQTAVISKAVLGIYLEHLKEILTTQSVKMFDTYLDKLRLRAKQGQKGLRRLLHSDYIKNILELLDNINSSPKLEYVREIILRELKENRQAKIIIFVKYREMGQYLTKYLNRLNDYLLKKQSKKREKTVKRKNANEKAAKVKATEGKYIIKAKRFVGQSTRTPEDKGMTQKEQAQVIKDFSSGLFNVLIATSVAEEGLDIPNVDAVVFYDSVPSEIRLIQRRGRTGRHRPGKCYYLVTENTLDAIYHHVSHHRENKMHDLLQSPGMVDTYDNIKRSDTLPVFKEQSLEDIQSRYQKNKDDSEEQQIRNLKALEEELIRRKKMGKSGRVRNKNAPKKAPRKKQNPSIVPTNFNNNSNPINKVEAPKSLVCDITLDLTKNARKGLASKKKKKTQIKSQKKKISRIFTKKYYDWIISTMEILGSNRGGYIYCELDEIYDAAREESVDMNRIESEIQKGLKANIFQTKHQFLMIKSM